MHLMIAKAGLLPALGQQSDELLDRQMVRPLDHGMQMVAVGCVRLPDHEHRQLLAEPLVGVPVEPSVQQAAEVLEIRLRDLVRYPLTIDDLFLGQRDVDRIWHAILQVVGFESALKQDIPRYGFGVFIWSLSALYRTLRYFLTGAPFS